MLLALARAIEQLSDPPVRRLVLGSIVAAAASFLALAAIIWVVLFHTPLTGLPALDTIVDVLGGFAAFGLAYFLFPSVVGGIAGLFLDGVVGAVERRYYPGLPPARGQSAGGALVDALRFFGLVIVLNLVALPLYLVPGVNLLLYYGLNGYLLGREYFDLVARRRLDRGAARALWRAHSLKLFLAGTIIAFLLTLPIVNLVAPVLGAAFMVHVFQRLNAGLRASAVP